MRVQVCIPHYFREHADPGENPNGYGSLRSGARLARSIALSRCITSLLDLQRRPETCLLNMSSCSIDHIANSETPLEVQISLCTDGTNGLQEVLDLYTNSIQVIDLPLDNPRDLPLACRDHLIRNHPEADLLSYLEDDLVIHDKLYFDKQLWFHAYTNHQFSLMPHRYERVDAGSMETLMVDGPLDPSFISKFAQPQTNVAHGQFRDVENVSFDVASNPHSGTFCVSREQAQQLQAAELPRDGFVGPLETAATLTVLHRYPVMKPSLNCWKFLRVEHGHPSFLRYINTLPPGCSIQVRDPLQQDGSHRIGWAGSHESVGLSDQTKSPWHPVPGSMLR
ncbi:MAG: hypothetical protein KXJ48_01280 [Vulcanococcus sp.]|jgi:hypothetical protein|nr:hypothetical protein [Vulcanococcus sp.]